jgi:hypothetical protein
VDCHGWQFTPASFELIILELAALKLIDFTIDKVFPSGGCEFTVHLRKVRDFELADSDLDKTPWPVATDYRRA